MTANTRSISNCSACTAPAGNNLFALVGNTSGVKNTFSLTVSNLFGNSQANIFVKDGYVLSSNVIVIRNKGTPANSEVGGAVNNSIWFDDDNLYVCLANGYIKYVALSSF